MSTVFYSWQSDLRETRNVTEAALEKAIRNLNRDLPIENALELDQDTRGVAGWPEITSALFDKIDQCEVFVADITPINGPNSDFRITPNPNVLVELGYALATGLGRTRIICAINTHYLPNGDLRELPFDLRGSRPVQFTLKAPTDRGVESGQEDPIRTQARAELARNLESASTLLAITGPMLIRMYDAYEEASADPDVRCIVVTGAGGNFCSGADLRAMAGDADASDPLDTRARMAEDPDIVYKALFRHYRPTKPIVAAVEGVAIAGGTELLQAMEIRVAGESARFGVSEARWSLYPMGGSSVRLPRQIPYTHAAEILLTGKHLSAAEALEIGLIGHIVPDGQALDKALELAAVVAANGPLATAAITRTLHECDGMELDDALRHEWDYGQAVFRSNDAKEGPRAFAEKRTPNFTGT